MASYYPPTNFFQNINFNNDFYAIPNNNQGISLAYANTHYLFSTGVATSTAITTFFSGSIGVGTVGGTAGTLNALNINAVNSIPCFRCMFNWDCLIYGLSNKGQINVHPINF